jgi:hypothetical protein
MSESMRLTIPPAWEELESVREKSARFLRTYGVHEDVVTAVSMVVCELSENATKYGAFDGRDDAIEITVTVARASVTVEVRNPVSTSASEWLGRLDRTIQWIRGFQDPFEAYLERLKEVSAQTLDSPESGLGLVRIAYEGQSVLDFFVHENNVLAVSAVHAI